jgi:hypothetical protein
VKGSGHFGMVLGAGGRDRGRGSQGVPGPRVAGHVRGRAEEPADADGQDPPRALVVRLVGLVQQQEEQGALPWPVFSTGSKWARVLVGAYS